MHIAEGVLSAPVLISGAVIAVVGVAVGLKKLQSDRLMYAGMLGAAFFVASLIHLPVGVGSAHLILNGLLGTILGVSAFPVIFVGLLLQAVLFQFGGLTVLGINTATMGLGAIFSWMIFRLIAGNKAQRNWKIASFLSGAVGVLASGVFTALALAFSDEGFIYAAWAIFISNIPVMLIEGFITMLIVGYIKRSNPEVLYV